MKVFYHVFLIVALSFTLARRESALLGIRVQGGLQAKRQSGGFANYAPDGYLNVSTKTSGEVKHLMGRQEQTIELDPNRAPIVRYAFDLLLADNLRLEDICEALHARGYRYRSGRPFIEIKPNGTRKANTNTLASMFHNWTYAGWVTSKKHKITGKSIRGDWEPIVNTEEFERGLEILDGRNQKKIANRKHDYLLKGMIYYAPADNDLVKLTGSTSNSGRAGGGTAYYCVPRSNINFRCEDIDSQIPYALHSIQVDPELLPFVRAAYTDDVAQMLGHLDPDEREKLEQALRAVDEEEARIVRIYANGMITAEVWEGLWREWQDRRKQIRQALESLESRNEVHIDNLDTALEIIANIGNVYNSLKRSDQKELLRNLVERVVVNPEGRIKLELSTPFAYLNDVVNSVNNGMQGEISGVNKKTSKKSAGLRPVQCSDWVLSCGDERSLSELPSIYAPINVLHEVAFPQRAYLVQIQNSVYVGFTAR